MTSHSDAVYETAEDDEDEDPCLTRRRSPVSPPIPRGPRFNPRPCCSHEHAVAYAGLG